jgi:hypothetical protein
VTQAAYEVGSGGRFDHQAIFWISLMSFISEIIKGEKLEASNWMATPSEVDGRSD